MSNLSLLSIDREPKILLVIDFHNLKGSIGEALNIEHLKFNPDFRRFIEVLFGNDISQYVTLKIVTNIIKNEKSFTFISALENIQNCKVYYPENEKEFFPNWDDEMIKIILDEEKTCDYDIICLVSGDGAFYSSLQKLLAQGKKTILVSRKENTNNCYLDDCALLYVDYSSRIKEFTIYAGANKSIPVDESKDSLLTFELLGIATTGENKKTADIKISKYVKLTPDKKLEKLLNSKKWLRLGSFRELLLQFYHSAVSQSDDMENVLDLFYNEFDKIFTIKISPIISELVALISNLQTEKTNTIKEIQNLKKFGLTKIEIELEESNSEKLKEEIAKTVRLLDSFEEMQNYMNHAKLKLEEMKEKENILKARIKTINDNISQLQRKLTKLHLKIEVIDEIIKFHIEENPTVEVTKNQPVEPDISNVTENDNEMLIKLDSLGMWSGLGTCQAYVVSNLVDKKCLKSEMIKKAGESIDALRDYLLSMGVKLNYVDKIYPLLIKNQMIINGKINFEKIQKIIKFHTKKMQNIKNKDK